MTGDEYRKSLEKRKPIDLILNGEKLSDPMNNPIIRMSVNSVAASYDLAHNPEYKEMVTAKSALTARRTVRWSLTGPRSPR